MFAEIFLVIAERSVIRLSSLFKSKSDSFSEDRVITQRDEIVIMHSNIIARSARKCCINFCRSIIAMFPLQVFIPE